MEKNRKRMIADIHFIASRMQVCLKCDQIFFGVCCLCGNKYYRKATEADYRGFLHDVTGKRSCADMSNEELFAVLAEMEKRGWLEYTKEERKRSTEVRNKMRHIIRQEATRLFRGYAQIMVDGFCEKVIGKPLSRLNEQELRRVIGWLRRYEKSMKKDHIE